MSDCDAGLSVQLDWNTQRRRDISPSAGAGMTHCKFLKTLLRQRFRGIELGNRIPAGGSKVRRQQQSWKNNEQTR